MVIRLPLDPYWENAVQWWSKQPGPANSGDYYAWMAEQGAIGLPRAVFTNYLEFEHEEDALLFRLRWA